MGFFPLYPLLVSTVSSVTGIPSEWSLILVAQTAYLAAVLLLYKLARCVRDAHAFALQVVIYLMLFPTSFFFRVGYAESTFLAFAIAGVYLMFRHPPQFVSSGVLIGLAAVARPTGWPVGVVLLTEFILRRDFRLKSVVQLLVAGLLAISGIVLFVFYTFSLTGNPWAITDAQALWKLEWQFPLLTLWNAIEMIFDGNLLRDNWFLYVLNIFDLAFGAFVIGLTIIAVRWSLQKKFSWSLTNILVISLIYMLMRRGFQVPLDEMARWAATLFPIYLIMALLAEHKTWLHRLIVIVSSLGLIFLVAWWSTGRWVG
jgi:hypothetical protein